MNQFKYIRIGDSTVDAYQVEHMGTYLGVVRKAPSGHWKAVGQSGYASTRARVAETMLETHRKAGQGAYDTYVHRAQQLSNAALMFLAAYLLKDLTDDQRYEAIEAARTYQKQQTP